MMGFVTTMIKVVARAALIFACAGALVAKGDCDYDDFPKMVDMRINALMNDAMYNNRHITAYSFSAAVSTDQLVGFYQDRWRDEYAESEFEAWQQISHLDDDCLFTVQYAPVGDNTIGRLLMSLAPKSEVSTVLGAGVLQPGGALVVSDMITDDGPKKGRVTVLNAPMSVPEMTRFYHTEMSTAGWSLTSSFNQYGGAVLVFRKGLDESNIVIMPAGDVTQVLINEVDVN